MAKRSAAKSKKRSEPKRQGDGIVLGAGPAAQVLSLRFANRHGLVAGATGTGKTVTLQVLAEGFSRAGVPVFAADIKGDLAGIAMPGEAKKAFLRRAEDLGLKYEPDEFPVTFWDLFGEQGHPVRASVFEMGPLLLSRMLDLNEVQEGILNIAFRLADENPSLGDLEANGLIDLKDLRELLAFLAENAKEVGARYGNVSGSSIGAIQRRLLVLENQGAEEFFGEPALAIKDLMRTDREGRGMVNILAADRLMENPRLYATFLLWLLSELFEELPEVGDPDKPKLVFFFDEAHLLFTDAPKALLEKVEQVVRLIRSKGVGVYFVTQNPLDVPDRVLAQLGNRVQHALRAFTPRDQRAVRAAAETFRKNPKLDTVTAITELGTGEALVSFLEGKGTPSVVTRVLVPPPTARLGPVTPQERRRIVAASTLRGKYDQAIDPESAYEVLQKKVTETAATEEAPEGGGTLLGGIGGMLGGIFGTNRPRGKRLSTGQLVARQVTRTVVGRVAGQIAADIGKSVAGSIGGSVGRAVVRGTLGGLLRR